LSNRRKEAWVLSALGYLNHPLRQQSFITHIPKTLEMLDTIKQTGDLFFRKDGSRLSSGITIARMSGRWWKLL